jgi:cysteinyl-tRNA synthetase
VTLRLHNTLTRQKEEFVPLDPANVRMYVCGPTVYDRIHIGNARPFVIFDVLYRLLRRQYGEGHVKYVRNITDIDDKINARAKARGIDIATLTRDTTRLFHEDMAELGCLTPDAEPTATGHVEEMRSMIQVLIDKGYAYFEQGHVLFNVPAMMEKPPLPRHIYGLLSKKNRDDLIAGARIDVAPYKKDPADFVLWKPSTPDLPGWDSPWGRGRPGWHIECSAMARKHLGASFDIHAGGLDLIFPHHENEIAQSECCNGAPMARYWMHNGFIERGGEKMAKSVGNIDKVRDLLDEFQGEALRLMLLKTHYRSPLEFTKEGLRASKHELDILYNSLQASKEFSNEGAVPDENRLEAFFDVLRDDLNSAEALTELQGMKADLNQALLKNDANGARTLRKTLVTASGHLGLLQQDPQEWLRWSPKSAGALDEGKIAQLIDMRLAARKSKNFKEADRIRDELAQQGVILEDGPKGTTWRRAG